MRKINLQNYITGDFETNVKQRVFDVLFDKNVKLNKQELINRNNLYYKIAASDIEGLLEESEHRQLKAAFDLFKGFDYTDIELINRIDNALEVEVIEKVD